jgi:hypothetical protein
VLIDQDRDPAPAGVELARQVLDLREVEPGEEAVIAQARAAADLERPRIGEDQDGRERAEPVGQVRRRRPHVDEARRRSDLRRRVAGGDRRRDRVDVHQPIPIDEPARYRSSVSRCGVPRAK